MVESDKLISRDIQIGLKNWNWTEVTSGLAEGDVIVTTLDRPEIKPGALVGTQKRDPNPGGVARPGRRRPRATPQGAASEGARRQGASPPGTPLP